MHAYVCLCICCVKGYVHNCTQSSYRPICLSTRVLSHTSVRDKLKAEPTYARAFANRKGMAGNIRDAGRSAIVYRGLVEKRHIDHKNPVYDVYVYVYV
jgi:hypothetical protein